MIDEAEQERQSMKGVELIGLSCGADGLRPITHSKGQPKPAEQSTTPQKDKSFYFVFDLLLLCLSLLLRKRKLIYLLWIIVF